MKRNGSTVSPTDAAPYYIAAKLLLQKPERRWRFDRFSMQGNLRNSLI